MTQATAYDIRDTFNDEDEVTTQFNPQGTRVRPAQARPAQARPAQSRLARTSPAQARPPERPRSSSFMLPPNTAGSGLHDVAQVRSPSEAPPPSLAPQPSRRAITAMGIGQAISYPPPQALPTIHPPRASDLPPISGMRPMANARSAFSSLPPSLHPADPSLLPMSVLRALLARYAASAGPAARPLLLMEIAALGVAPQGVPRVLSSQLLRNLAERLDVADTRLGFIRDARRIIDNESYA